MNESDPNENRARPVLACLGTPSRFRLVRALSGADRCVGELADAVGLSQSCTTRHLQALERVGLVRRRREGRRVRFSLRAAAPGLGTLLGWALSGAGLEALAAGADLHCDRIDAGAAGASVRPAPAKAARSARPAGAPQAMDETVRVPASTPESKGAPGTRDLEPEDHPGADRSAPVRRPGDLEDYLL